MVLLNYAAVLKGMGLYPRYSVDALIVCQGGIEVIGVAIVVA